MAEEKVSTGIILPITIIEQLDTMARNDRRDRSAEIAFLTEQEWNRRNPDPQSEPPFIAVRRATR